MVILIFILWILISSCQDIQSQFHLYYMDHSSNPGMYYDCLYYKVFDDTMEHSFEKAYQIIPYCIRPFPETEEVYNKNIEGNVLSRFTFEELRKKQVTTHDLLSWSPLIDLVERYDEYLNSPSNISSKLEMFYNCSASWFGTFCQYTFKLNQSFHDIVNTTFQDKRYWSMLNMTCYIHSKCDRGPAPSCLDWREICDGKLDCIGDDIDEMNCFELEVNECEENEFRCHNGICIPEEFLNEGPYYPDCLDGTDEDNRMVTPDIKNIPSFFCTKDPGFWCEETDYAKLSRFYVCGDGQRSDESFLYVSTPLVKQPCRSSRDSIMKKSLLSYVEHSDLSYDCWFFLRCSTIHDNGLDCSALCDESDESDEEGCYINIKSKCNTNFVIFPHRPVLQGYVLFVYLTNKTIIFVDEETLIFPDYVCYDVKRCPFLPTTSTLNINGTTCQSTERLDLKEFIDIIHLFQSCLIVSGNELEINRAQSSLFQCPGTTKYISKHRVLDGNIDCYHGTDEENIDACQWNHKHRFKCSPENKCISHVSVRNSVKDCLTGEDELPIDYKQIPFQIFCNGYVHLSAELIDGFNETDETHCDYWPCNNLYTRCDGAWNCPNGADELNCISSKCPSDTHECVSPQTWKVICLPVHLAGNGIIDCLGSTDERAHCRSQQPKNANIRYRCWNDTFCVHNTDVCSDDSCVIEDYNECSKDVKSVFERLYEDKNLQSLVYGHFMLRNTGTTLRSLKIFSPNLTRIMPDLLISSEQPNSLIPLTTNQENVILNRIFSFHRTETCNRGILIYVGPQLAIHCLCPPSYFGNRCQFQSQRVSLILQFSRICAPDCYGIFGIIVTLIDQDNIIHDHQQFIYTATHKCANKIFVYLLYQSRPKDMTKSYHVRIDAYNKLEMIYHASWILPIKFIFLPVDRISARLIIPAHSVLSATNCPLFCGHGQCFTYVNTKDQYFCHCHSGWFGVNCTISHNCDCFSGSNCVGHINNRSICLCSLRNYGTRCRLPSICQNGTCMNGGQCVPNDERVSRHTFICLCPAGFLGTTCEIPESSIHISFKDIEIPRSLLVHFITVRTKADPMRTTISTKVPYDRDIATVHILIPFHVIITQISNEYFLAYTEANYTPSFITTIEIKPERSCLHVQQLFDNITIGTYPLLRRVKSYHLICKNQPKLECFHDNEEFLCLCNDERHANCFSFDFNTTNICQGFGDCQNDAQCLLDHPDCPHSIFCICTDCFYGSKCQFNTKGFGLSLDAILGYQIQPHLPINRQPIIVQISIALTIIFLVIGVTNSILSIITFRRKQSVESGCRQYLLATSIVSLYTTILFSIKFLMLILSQMSLITNIMILRISCILIDFLLRLGPVIVDWLNASVAVDRALIVTMGTKFDKKKSKQAVRWVVIGILVGTVGSILHDPIHRQLVYDEAEERRWCLVQYSSSLEICNSIINIIHFLFLFWLIFSRLLLSLLSLLEHAPEFDNKQVINNI